MRKFFTLLMCLVLGIVCLAGCTNNDEAFTQKSYTEETPQIKEVIIDVWDRQIEVMVSSDNQIHIDYFENSKEYYDISVSDKHVLTMTAASNKNWTDYIGGKSAVNSRKILLQLPESLLTALKLSTTNEDILLSGLTVASDISLSTQGGNVIFDKINVENSINLKAKNGNISGAIVGSYDDYTILSDIKKGESNLPSNKEGGTKTLNVSNNNGDIAIEFISQ